MLFGGRGARLVGCTLGAREGATPVEVSERVLVAEGTGAFDDGRGRA